LPASDVVWLQRYLSAYEDPTGSARDLGARIERAGPSGHAVYPEKHELPFLLRALRDAQGSLSDAGVELLEELLREIG
jgi:hypothetical protein